MLRFTTEMRSTVALVCVFGFACVAFTYQQETSGPFYVPQPIPQMSKTAVDMRLPMQYQGALPMYYQGTPQMEYQTQESRTVDPVIFGLGLLCLGGGVAMLLTSGEEEGESAEEPAEEPSPESIPESSQVSIPEPVSIRPSIENRDPVDDMMNMMGNMPSVMTADADVDWSMKRITPNGKLKQRIEGATRKTWKFSNPFKDRVQVALTSEGRPVHAEVNLWLGPDYTPYTLKCYSEDGKSRPIQSLVGTRNKSAMIEVKNVGDSTFPLSAASSYAHGAMEALPHEIPENVQGERVDGGALRSFPIDPASESVEVMLNTDGRHMQARVELLNAPNNPKQTFEVYASDGEKNSLCVSFKLPDQGNTLRIVNMLSVEYPLNIRLIER